MKVLVAGDPRSIHTARFAGLLQDLGHEVHVYSVDPQYEQEEHLRGVTLHVALAYRPAVNGNRIVGRGAWLAPLCRSKLAHRVVSRLLHALAAPGKVTGEDRLVATLTTLRPDLVFSLKMQNEGYTVAAARAAMGPDFRAPWVHFTWGTDIEFFGKDAQHAARHLPLIRDLLARCDFHIADTQRDLAQATSLGFSGRTLGAMPAAGGFDLDYIRRLRAGQSMARDTVLVKGRHGGYIGKALHVLDAIRRRPETVRGWRVRVFMASRDVAAAAAALRSELGIDCEVLPRLDYEELLRWYGRSAIAVSASDVDGTPAFLLEALAMGALPVHSDMASLREWVDHGRNGLLFPVDDVEALGACLDQALQDAPLRERAARANWKIVEQRVDRATLREQLRQWIAQAVSGR
jgi:glycosyltransferase involved in cell wall biosynthesis